MCIQNLQRPNDTELKLDMQKHEDSLTILNIVIAREHARQELRNKDIERECQITTMNPSKDVNAETILPDNDQAQNTTTITNECSKGENQNSLPGVTENSKIKSGKALKQIGEHICRLILFFHIIIPLNRKLLHEIFEKNCII